MTVVKNFTPHTINIIDPSSVESKPEIRKLVSENPVVIASIPSDGMLNVQHKLTDSDPIKWVYLGDGVSVTNDIPIRNKVRESIDPIPDDCDVAIVSGVYAAATDDPRAYTVIDPVYDSEGTRVIGCLAVGKVIN
jgi:hypothetical protein